MCMFMSLSVEELLLLRHVKWSTNFKGLWFNEEMVPFWLKHMTSFYLSSCRDQSILLHAPACAAEIWLEQVYLQEVLDHLCSLESNSLLPHWSDSFLCHYHWSPARRYIGTNSIHIQPRLHTRNIFKSNEKKKRFPIKKAKNRQHPAETITDANYVDDLALLANTPAQAKSLLHRLEHAARWSLCELR